MVCVRGSAKKVENSNFQPATENVEGKNLLGFLRLRPRPFCFSSLSRRPLKPPNLFGGKWCHF